LEPKTIMLHSASSLVAALPLLAQADQRAQEAVTICTPPEGEFNSVCALLYGATGVRLVATTLGDLIPALAQILVIVLLAWVLNRVLRRLLKNFVRSLQNQGIQRLSALRSRSPLADTTPMDLARATMRTETLGGVLRSVTTFIVWALAVFLVLAELGIELGPLIAGAGIAGIALGFGAQNLVKDFLSGMFMLAEDQYGVGDVVDVGEATGQVEAITLRTTRLRDVEGVVWHVPNGEIRRVGNKSQQWSRALLDIGVSYGTDIPRAIQVIKEVADSVWHDPEFGPLVLEEPEVWGVEQFGPNQVFIRLVLKVAPLKQWDISRELRKRLKGAFDRAGIEIPTDRMVWMRHSDGESEGGSDVGKGAARDRGGHPQTSAS
jgi:moderate conductance mechanosensitive channel